MYQHESFLYNTPSYIICLCLVVLMILFFYLGYLVKKIKVKNDPSYVDAGLGTVEGSLLGLLALLLSFTFSSSSSRNDSRFQAMIQESNTISTAALRADLFPDRERTALLGYFKNYVESRIQLYEAGQDIPKETAAAKQSEVNAGKLWALSVAAVKSDDATVRNRGSLMVSSLNDMINAMTNRQASRETMMPELILYLLFLLCIAGSFIIGYGSKQKFDWIVASGFAVMIAITVFSILYLDRPHSGLITLEKAEQSFLNLREMFK